MAEDKDLLVDDEELEEDDEAFDTSRFDDIKNRVFRFERGFLAKLIQSSDDKKEYYLAIKNILLSYKDVKCKTSWKHEYYTIGRNNVCGFKVRGKSLYVYLPYALDSAEAKKYKLSPSTDKRGKLKTTLKLDKKKACNTACKLVEQALSENGNLKKSKDFKPLTLKNLPYETTEQLLNKGIIKFFLNQSKMDINIVDMPMEAPNFTQLTPDSRVTKESFEGESKPVEQTQTAQGGAEGAPISEKDLSQVVDSTIKAASKKLSQVMPNKNLNNAVNPFKNIYIDTSKDKGARKVLYKSLDIYDGRFEYRKDYILRAIDEKWVSAIEEVTPIISKIIRNPSRTLEENEIVVQASLSRKVTSRSVRHLLQHVENISEITPDNEVIPAKLLNVLMDETIKTYENKFLNTLILRMFIFVNRRYEIAKKEMADEVRTTVSIDQAFKHNETHVSGKIHLDIELSEPAKNVIVLKNYTFTTDLWKRVENLNKVCLALLNSSFCMEMGKTYVRPPIMRTNAIMKNKDLHQCLLLWQFIEGYETAGYEMLVESEVRQPNPMFYQGLCTRLAEQYIAFVHDVRENAESDVTLDEFITENIISPKVVEEAEPISFEDLDLASISPKIKLGNAKSKANKVKITPFEDTVIDAVKIALEADRLIKGKDPKEIAALKDITEVSTEEESTSESPETIVNEEVLADNVDTETLSEEVEVTPEETTVEEPKTFVEDVEEFEKIVSEESDESTDSIDVSEVEETLENDVSNETENEEI